jgi:hypothetical protein
MKKPVSNFQYSVSSAARPAVRGLSSRFTFHVSRFTHHASRIHQSINPPGRLQNSKTPKLQNSAFSLIEILVAVALMSFIVLGLLVTFNHVSRVFRGGMSQVDIMAGGRAIMDSIMRDMEQLAPTETQYAVNFSAEGSALFTPPLIQGMPPDFVNGPKRINIIQKLFFINKLNQDWTATGYQVLPLPDYPNSGCVGSLYRFTTTTRGNLAQASVDFRNAALTNLSLVADGVVHFSVQTFATNGFPINPNPGYPGATNGYFLDAQIPGTYYVNNTLVRTNVPALSTDCYFLSNAVPAYVELELGILESQVLERFRSIGNPAAQRAYIEQHIAQVHIFRQRVPIRNVDFSAYVNQ